MCVIIVCTVASQCTRRYAHDLEEQRRIFVGVGWRSPSADRAQIVPFWAIKDSEGRSSGVCLGPSSYQRPYIGTASGVTRPVLSPGLVDLPLAAGDELSGGQVY
jgi:hypothetical protein